MSIRGNNLKLMVFINNANTNNDWIDSITAHDNVKNLARLVVNWGNEDEEYDTTFSKIQCVGEYFFYRISSYENIMKMFSRRGSL